MLGLSEILTSESQPRAVEREETDWRGVLTFQRWTIDTQPVWGTDRRKTPSHRPKAGLRAVGLCAHNALGGAADEFIYEGVRARGGRECCDAAVVGDGGDVDLISGSLTKRLAEVAGGEIAARLILRLDRGGAENGGKASGETSSKSLFRARHRSWQSHDIYTVAGGCTR